MEHISKFLRRRVKSDPDFGDLVSSNKSDKAGQYKHGQKSGIHSAQNTTNQVKRPIKCHVCEDNHKVTGCPTYKDCTANEKVQVIKRHRLCFSCLVRGHVTRDCRSKRPCGKDGCTKTHHPSIHVDPPSASATNSTLDKDGILPVLRARFRSVNGRVREGNILVDSGAATTIIRKDFAIALGLQGKREGLQLSVVGGEKLNQRDSRRVRFWISPLTEGEEFEIEAHELNETVISVPPLDRAWLSSFPHLSDVEFTHKAVPIDLILGVQYSHLHAEEEIRQGLPFEPGGKRTRLGWFVIGADCKASSDYSVRFVHKVVMTAFYNLETLGVRVPDCDCSQNAMSPDDKRTMGMFESSCGKVGDRYQIGLPWKKDPKLLPNNLPLAEKRLQSLERSLLKNPEKAELYGKAIQQYEDNNWAVPVTREELESDVSPVYYLPHHGVYRSDKPSTPLRVVFDPSCQFNGVSLNSFLHKGPCLNGDLLGALLMFREERVAFAGDISKMFLQILLPERDSNVHRILWRNLDVSGEPTVYLLTRVTFGDKPSPDMASFIMLKLADAYEDQYPEAAVVIRADSYMDDLIHSCKTAAEASQCMKQLDEILSSGSFRIKQWFCSSAQALHGHSGVHEASTRPVPDVSLSDSGNLKTLGVCWNSQADTIYFKVKDLNVEILTKRIVLSKISMIYDRLGLASAVTIRARVAMQGVLPIWSGTILFLMNCVVSGTPSLAI